MTQVSGTLITRNYNGFRGVDFSNRKDEISLNRSPDALNMWKNYKSNNGKCIETRPDVELLEEYSDTIFGLFFYTANGTKHFIVHSGDKLYDNGKQLNLVHKEDNMSSMADTFMAKNKSNMFVMNNILYIMDGTQYLRYDGTELTPVVGYIPRTSIGRSPMGGNTILQDVNLLNNTRVNSFSSDGVSTEYLLDEVVVDTKSVKVWVDDVEVTTFTATEGSNKIVFKTAPKEPLTPGQDNVFIQFKTNENGFRERIEKCTIVELFDNRVFFSGNPDYPNMVWYSELENPDYVGTTNYMPEGTTDSAVKSLVPGNNAMWVMKEPSQSNTTIFYHTPSIDALEDGRAEKTYPPSHSSISTGCATTGVNFNDTICFFSERGLEAISGDVTTEQVIRHVSSLVDSKLLNESKYKEMMLEEWEGYLLVILGNKVYLADSRAMVNINGSTEFEWFYWEFKRDITSTLVKDGVLYLCSDDKVKENGVEVIKHRIYTLTKTDTEIESYWTSVSDEGKYPHYYKSTNKKGCCVDFEGEEITISVQTDNKGYDEIGTYKNTKGYIVPKIKKKKWKSIQMKFSSDKPFSLYSYTLEFFCGAYVKR